MVYNFFDKKTEMGVNSSVNEELAQKSHKPMIKKFKKGKVYATFNPKKTLLKRGWNPGFLWFLILS